MLGTVSHRLPAPSSLIDGNLLAGSNVADLFVLEIEAAFQILPFFISIEAQCDVTEVAQVLLDLAADIDDLVRFLAELEDVAWFDDILELVAAVQDAVFAELLRRILIEQDEHARPLERMNLSTEFLYDCTVIFFH